jgi:hypothetical protein
MPDVLLGERLFGLLGPEADDQPVAVDAAGHVVGDLESDPAEHPVVLR